MIIFYEPRLEELWFKQALLADPETMAYNHAWGGTIAFPRDRWEAWYGHWVAQPEDKRFYRYLREGDAGDFVGEAAYHWDEESGRYLADVIVHARYRKKGYGRQGLKLLCRAAKERGVSVLYDNMAVDNPALPLFLQEGFCEEERTDELIWLKKQLTD